MSFKDNWLYKGLAISASSVLLFTASAAYSQEMIESEEVTSEVDANDAESSRPVEEVVVTGSRLKRSTFTSISPLQIITADMSREAGLVSASDILQTSTSAGGQQVDLTFSGFVLDNGPGTRTVNLRGLGSSRTLVLVNGRRLAPGGAEGAPYAPNVGLIPAGLVSQYEVLTDGASSVYGSDAIGGVTNIILKKDFDGLVIEGGANAPKYDGGDNVNLNITWGQVWDRGLIGMGLDYNRLNHASYSSRPWTDGCEKNYEITSDGEYRTKDLFWDEILGVPNSVCKAGAQVGYVSIDDSYWEQFQNPYGYRFGTWGDSLWYTPGQGNGGVPDFSWFRGPFTTRFVDSDGDGVPDVDYTKYYLSESDLTNEAFLYPDDETATFMAYGEYTFEGDANVTAYFEMLYSENEYSQLGQPGQFFPDVPAMNPYNICNPDGVRGVDCALAEYDFMFGNAAYAEQWGNEVVPGTTPLDFSFLLYNGGYGALPTQPVVSVAGDRNSVEATYKNARFVAGLTGDMPSMDIGTLSNWSFDVYASYSKSKGESHRSGIREDRLNLALGVYSSIDSDGDGMLDDAIPCENNIGAVLDPGVNESSCVPVDMYAESLFVRGGVGDFATEAERNYLFDDRDFDTEYEQTILSGSMGGSVFEMPSGSVLMSLGFEYRKDEINSMPDAVARDGLFFGYFADGGAVGSKDSKELFVEVEAPLLANKPLAKELTLNASMRFTDDEIYGSNTTESVKIGWRPVNSLLIRGTYGSAFRAPNLRELYLANQTGFNFVFDPCATPSSALASGGDIEAGAGQYDASLDPREQEVLNNCIAEGIDPTDFLISPQYSVEQGAGGSLELAPETSDSWTAGFSYEQEFSNEFEFGVSATYYEVDIDDTIIEPSAGFIIGDCYTSRTGSSPFCDRISRGEDSRISFVDRGFINRDNENARGVDVNVTFEDQFTIADRPIDFSWDLRANRQIERSTLFINDDGSLDYDDYAGEWGFPDWKANSTIRLTYEKWRLQLRSNWMSAVDQDPRYIDAFTDINGRPYDENGDPTLIASDTCLGGPDDVLCRDVGFADDYMVHSLSLSYIEDNWALTIGASNLFDKEPPIVDPSEGPGSINNTPIGYGYNLFGRAIYMNFAYDFGSN